MGASTRPSTARRGEREHLTHLPCLGPSEPRTPSILDLRPASPRLEPLPTTGPIQPGRNRLGTMQGQRWSAHAARPKAVKRTNRKLCRRTLLVDLRRPSLCLLELSEKKEYSERGGPGLPLPYWCNFLREEWPGLTTTLLKESIKHAVARGGQNAAVPPDSNSVRDRLQPHEHGARIP